MARCHTTLIALAVAVLGSAAPVAADQALRTVEPATVVMRLVDVNGNLERPQVEFNHAAHTTALKEKGCEPCHKIDETGLVPTFVAKIGIEARDDLIDAVHDTCTACHRERTAAGLKAGPVTCGECHVRLAPGVSMRAVMAFDYSLHARHAAAFPEKCDTCHHVYDEVQQKLRYEKGAEEACSSCHGDQDVEKTPSLANASHHDCVGCHLKRIGSGLEGGPVLCVRCHDAARRGEIKRLEEIPRLVRGQPDTLWIKGAEAGSKLVPFDHKAHEPETYFCTDCHHRTMRSCVDCHTVTGSEEGAGITTADSYHVASSTYSCVGCHALTTGDSNCSGCHRQPGSAPAPSSCVVCHGGPQQTQEPLEVAPPEVRKARLSALPPASDDFPETVTISSMLDEYQASTMPHLKIVTRLDTIVRQSALAGSFHGTVETLCAGCHHHSPVGTRPPTCRACHSESAATTIDRPGLKAAYHRACVGCHRDMGVAKQGCTDCHAPKEVQS